jgi:predicted membrane-bound spermidine synthase
VRVNRFSSAAVLFLSGAAALIFQLLWIKQLSLVVGVDVYAVTTAVSAFFAGLALGSAIIGSRADGAARPLRLYALLELGIGLMGVGTTLALAHAAPLFASIESAAGPVAWLLPFLLVGLPAVLMGGTVPVMLRSVTVDGMDVARAGGVLYAANTAGAIAGALAAPFVLIPLLGVRGSALAAAAFNLAAAGVSAAMNASTDRIGANEGREGGRGRTDKARLVRSDRGESNREGSARLALRLYAIAGGVALGYEVIWSQAIVQFISTRVFAFAIVLATYLAGLAMGSVLFASLAARIRHPWTAFGLLVAAAGLAAVGGITTLGPWLLVLQSNAEEALRAMTGNELAAMCARFIVAAFGIVFVPTVLLGAAFPAALRLAAGAERPGRDTGAVLAWNTAGGIAGTLLTGFVLVPAFGIVRSLGLLALAAAVLGAIAVWRESNGRGRSVVLAIAVASIAAVALTPEDQIARLLTASRSRGNLLFYAESAGGTVAVVQQQAGPATFRRLYIQGVSNSGDALTSMRYMRLQALLPLLIHRGQPSSALVIGLGTGITAGALLAYPGLDRRVCAELLPAVIQAAPLFAGNFDAPSDRRLEIRVRDGRRELLQNDARYDLITLEPPPPSARGVANLYSRDFYELAKRRLRPDGLLAQWWPLPTQNDEDSRSLVRSFVDAFPHASVWTTELHEMLLVGSTGPMELDASRIAARFEQTSVAQALAAVGVMSPPALIATWITGRDGLERYAGGAAPVTDDRPRIEYATWTRRDEFRRVLPLVLALASEPPLVNATPAFVGEVATERSRLRLFYEAGLRASLGDRTGAATMLAQVLNEDSGNAYYRWSAGLPTN